MTLTVISKEVLDDVRSAAWLESELHPDLNRHRRHEMADICEPDNIERVWRVLALCETQVRIALARILSHGLQTRQDNVLLRPAKWDFHFKFPLSASVSGYIREMIHEYMVASVIADRALTIIPDAASAWRVRMDNMLSALRNLAATTRLPAGPVRRPLWPL